MVLSVFLCQLLVTDAAAQNTDTVALQAGTRGHGLSYRTAEWIHTFKNKFSTDVLYYGFPGDNEAYLGVGRVFQVKGKNCDLTVTPYIWGVIGKENGEKGLATGGYLSGTLGGLNLSGSLYVFFPLAGSVAQYTYLDGLDLTKSFCKHFELGVSGAFFHPKDGPWDPLVGPVFRVNDKLGATSIYVRTGPNGTETRFARSFNLKLF